MPIDQRIFPSVEMLTLADLTLETEYRTGEADLIRDFYRPCLVRAVKYDRAVGYFRSSIYAVAGGATVQFAQSGGRIRLVCSPELTAEDWEAVRRGYSLREVVEGSLSRDFDRLVESVELRKYAEVLATLIQTESLDLRIALRPPEHGMFHEKIGLFEDSRNNQVSFKGSSNETWQGWHERGNLESIEVFCSWRDETEAVRVKRHREYFNRLWDGQLPQVSVLPIPDALRIKLDALARAESMVPAQERGRTVAQSRSPLPHQEGALAAWTDRGYRGIFEHATGSGKTYTAILAIIEHVKHGNVALVVVPSRLLLEQWASELDEFLPEAATVLLVGAGRNAWRKAGRLERFSKADLDLGPRVILATMATASKLEFRSRLSQGEHLLIVADEVHQTGSPHNSKLFSIEASKRLGLSATPRRYGDTDGTQALMSYFGGLVPPPFTLSDAIASGRLVQYEYHPHALNLSISEGELWAEFTDRIKLEVARLPRNDQGTSQLSEFAKLLLIQRARIAKKAQSKVRLASGLLKNSYEDGQHWLVYCEDVEQLSVVMAELHSVGLSPREYHSSMRGDPPATLDWFSRFGGILVSIRCLDEGVDIPQVSHALILASSQNPRQFIQRRGRVLRASPNKTLAVIHDAIVVPPSADEEPEQIALAKSELLRALEFAESAFNRNSGAELREIALNLGISHDSLTETGIEEEEVDGD